MISGAFCECPVLLRVCVIHIECLFSLSFVSGRQLTKGPTGFIKRWNAFLDCSAICSLVGCSQLPRGHPSVNEVVCDARFFFK